MLTKPDLSPRVLKTSGAAGGDLCARAEGADAAIDPNTLGRRPLPQIASTALSPSTARAWSRLYSGKVDLGTGTDTALTQIAAEELGVPMQRVEARDWRYPAHSGSGAHLRQPHDPERRRPESGRPARRHARALLDQAAPENSMSRGAILWVEDGWIRGNGKARRLRRAGGRSASSSSGSIAKAPLKDLCTTCKRARLDIPGKVDRDAFDDRAADRPKRRFRIDPELRACELPTSSAEGDALAVAAESSRPRPQDCSSRH